MLVAMVPSSIANQLHGRPEMLEPALAKNSCQQRGVQSQTFQCTFNAEDGPQSLVVVPEAARKCRIRTRRLSSSRRNASSMCAAAARQHERVDRESQSLTPSIVLVYIVAR